MEQFIYLLGILQVEQPHYYFLGKEFQKVFNTISFTTYCSSIRGKFRDNLVEQKIFEVHLANEDINGTFPVQRILEASPCHHL